MIVCPVLSPFVDLFPALLQTVSYFPEQCSKFGLSLPFSSEHPSGLQFVEGFPSSLVSCLLFISVPRTMDLPAERRLQLMTLHYLSPSVGQSHLGK